jgi:hypothetical protein
VRLSHREPKLFVPATWLKRFDVLEGDLAMSATIISSDCGATLVVGDF